MGRGRLNQLDQDPASVLRVDEVDPRLRCAAARNVVQQAHARGPELVADRVNIAHSVSELLQPLAVAINELGDGRLFV